jgi:hypothetical protein
VGIWAVGMGAVGFEAVAFGAAGLGFVSEVSIMNSLWSNGPLRCKSHALDAPCGDIG